MTGDKSTGDKAAADPATLIRQVRVLERKLARSEESRVRLEEAKDRFDTLHRNLFRELDEQKALVDEKNNMLESLSSKLSKYLAPQVYQSIFSGRQDVSLETKRKTIAHTRLNCSRSRRTSSWPMAARAWQRCYKQPVPCRSCS